MMCVTRLCASCVGFSHKRNTYVPQDVVVWIVFASCADNDTYVVEVNGEKRVKRVPRLFEYLHDSFEIIVISLTMLSTCHCCTSTCGIQ